jgi:hypothetical protein
MSSELPKITLDQADALLRSHIGLLCGPCITRPEASFPAIASMLARKFDLGAESNYLRAAQVAIDKGEQSESITNAIREFISGTAVFTQIDRVANLRWSAVMSFALDSSLEAEMRRACARRTSGMTVTDVVSFPQGVPLKTVPVFKLLGTLDSQDFVHSERTYAVRRPTWRFPVREFADRIKSGPVFCLGLADCHPMLLDLLAELVFEPRTVAPLLFIDSEFDEIGRKSIGDVVAGRAQIAFIDAKLSDVVSRLKDVERAGPTLPLLFSSGDKKLERLAPYHDLIAIVNTQLASPIRKDETEQLADLLFSPALARWDPFFHKLDFPRSLTKRMVDALQRPTAKGKEMPAFVLIGSAASGKTTIAKRVAYDIAEKGHIVMWLRRAFFPNAQTMLSDFFRSLGEVTDKGQRYYFFIDDPIGIGSTSVRGIASAAAAKGIHCTFVIVARLSDWETHEQEELIDGLRVVEKFTLEDQFEKEELQALPNYLVRLNISKDKDTANAEIRKAPSRVPSDTLGLLYFLLPKTRRVIEASIQEEYLRLGEQAGLSRVVIGAYEKTTEFLRNAYGMVAVGDHYHTPVPLEVLVSALEIPYREWLDTVGQEGAAWGLLYGEPSSDGETVVYRPRNAIVTRILVELINGGRLGARAGEVQQLIQLLRACSGTSPIYRQFCVNVLVPCSKISHLDYQDGLQLYETALSALPLEDRTLVHQKGVWIKDEGKDPLLAKAVLEEALRTKVYPYTTRQEAQEHIHTSLAATVLDAVDAGQVSLEEAIPEILRHVDQALSESFFTPRAVHVQANLMLRVLEKVKDRASADTFSLVNQALLALDSALLILRNPLRHKSARPTKDIGLLEEITGKIFERIIPQDELTETAKELFEQFRRQDGFVIAARKLYHTAREKNSGSSYNEAFTYCREVMKDIERAGVSPVSDLYAVAVCIYYEWNVNRYDPKAGNRQIDWDLLYRLSGAVLKGDKYKSDTFYRYVCGLSLAEQGDWSGADPFFAQNRKSGIPNDHLYQLRAVFLDAHGVRTQVQGTITGTTGAKRYFYVKSLHQDFRLSRDERWPNVDETAHAFIGFTFGGPVAVQNLDA